MHIYPNYHKKVYNHIKKFSSSYKYKKKLFCMLNIKKENFSIDELKLIAERRNISDYENKSKEDLLKAFTKPKSKIEIKNNKLKKNRKDFYNLRHTFSKN